jgi:hypothetical protein
VTAGLYFAYGYFRGNRNYTYAARTSTIIIHAAGSGAFADGANGELVFFDKPFFPYVEGQSPTMPVPVLYFKDTDVADPVSAYSTTIDWGDGSTTPVTPTYDPGSDTFTVSGMHRYAEEGSYNNATVTINHDTSYVIPIPTQVADAQLTANGVDQFNATQGVRFSTRTLATFSDPGGMELASDYPTTIDWGDGTPLDTGTVTVTSTSGSVSGSHTYAQVSPAGGYVVTVNIPTRF